MRLFKSPADKELLRVARESAMELYYNLTVALIVCDRELREEAEIKASNIFLKLGLYMHTSKLTADEVYRALWLPQHMEYQVVKHLLITRSRNYTKVYNNAVELTGWIENIIGEWINHPDNFTGVWNAYTYIEARKRRLEPVRVTLSFIVQNNRLPVTITDFKRA